MAGTCPDEELLAAFVHRDLPGPSAQEVERHIDECVTNATLGKSDKDKKPDKEGNGGGGTNHP